MISDISIWGASWVRGTWFLTMLFNWLAWHCPSLGCGRTLRIPLPVLQRFADSCLSLPEGQKSWKEVGPGPLPTLQSEASYLYPRTLAFLGGKRNSMLPGWTFPARMEDTASVVLGQGAGSVPKQQVYLFIQPKAKPKEWVPNIGTPLSCLLQSGGGNR